MFRQLSMCAVLLVGATACKPSTEPVATIGGSGPTHPVSEYRCGETSLAVQLLGESVSVSIDGATPIQLAQKVSNNERTVYSDGRKTITIEAGRLSWEPQQGSPVGCVGG
jgi:hypothetical protein